MSVPGIVLCGGASRRMGTSKAWLDFHGQPLLCRVVAVVSQVVSPVIVVAGPNQSLPELPGNVLIARDPVEYAGPLVGLAAGLATTPTHVSHVFVTACDAPFLTVELIAFMLTHANPGRALLPVIHGERQPLPAVYPIEVHSTIQTLLSAGQTSLRSMWDVVPIDELTENDIKTIDPDLAAFRSMNERHEYDKALRDAQ